MHVLVVKTSSMGDIIHTLPALTDAALIFPDIRFDWVVEERFAAIPAWHPRVDKVIPVAIRRWRKNIWQAFKSGELQAFYRQLRERRYDYVIDAQGLLKSAVLTWFSRGVRCGLNRQSAWESLASLAYQRHAEVNPQQHAVTRVRQLFSQSLSYPLLEKAPEYSIDRSRLPAWASTENYLVFLPNTTWASKQWPEAYWHQLVQLAIGANWQVLIAWGSPSEQQQAQRLASQSPQVQALPYLNVTEMAGVLANAKAVVGVDTGFAHLAAAMSVPTLSIYGATNPEFTGTLGDNQHHLRVDFACAPCLSSQCQFREPAPCQPACFQTLPPEYVWQRLQEVIG
jgi:heptosyltransferase-1